MWDDEDNNPYGSFQRRGSESSDIQSPGERESVLSSWWRAIYSLAVHVLTDQDSTDHPPHHQSHPRPSSTLTSSLAPPISAMRNLMMTAHKVQELIRQRVATTAAFSKSCGNTPS